MRTACPQFKTRETLQTPSVAAVLTSLHASSYVSLHSKERISVGGGGERKTQIVIAAAAQAVTTSVVLDFSLRNFLAVAAAREGMVPLGRNSLIVVHAPTEIQHIRCKVLISFHHRALYEREWTRTRGSHIRSNTQELRTRGKAPPTNA